MSETYNTPDGILIGAFVGPENEGPDRQRWQIETEGMVTLTREDVYWLMVIFSQSLFDRPKP